MWNGYTASWMWMQTMRKRAWKCMWSNFKWTHSRRHLVKQQNYWEQEHYLADVILDSDLCRDSKHGMRMHIRKRKGVFASSTSSHLKKYTKRAILSNNEMKKFPFCSSLSGPGCWQSAMNWEIFENYPIHISLFISFSFIWFSFIRIFRKTFSFYSIAQTTSIGKKIKTSCSFQLRLISMFATKK